jgi:MFS family permease
MNPSHILLFTIHYFGIGLLVPVLSLVFLSHGGTLATISLCIGIFAVMVVLLELPSGILADMIGRKRIYLISCCFMLANYLILLISRSFFLLAAACAIQGIGRAFSSGSIESLEIENYIETHGVENLKKINSTMAVTESAGLALGSIAGGLLGFADPTYTLLILIAAALQILLFLLTIFTVREKKTNLSHQPPTVRLKEHLAQLVNSLTQSKPIVSIILMSSVTGLLICAVEIYWQPSLKLILPDNMDWLLGVITCLGFIGTSFGNKVAEWYSLTKQKHLFILRILFACSIMLLGVSHNVWMFMAIFVLIYILLGAGTLAENTLFHTAIPNGQRASMMSVLSLSLRAGGLGTSLLGSLIVAGISLSAVWVVVPFIAVIIVAIVGKFAIK